ncbi:hypothetical protein BO78DRAFT_28172 [Aspergillus sclerotiicarbonarius CBS 121057]|uniref:Uncharacterized protein n=1 Tax=Aspergillus sclerotiicarbonarius (strain CBS 121057 / IBT 28362) TaxID=1448318 RepID=A0A319DTD8_ASPSB|nr:hypothetical protein BO78DRAFT_28172 [Aspergillus sclerotiicarbonarius CBS 121057]
MLQKCRLPLHDIALATASALIYLGPKNWLSQQELMQPCEDDAVNSCPSSLIIMAFMYTDCTCIMNRPTINHQPFNPIYIYSTTHFFSVIPQVVRAMIPFSTFLVFFLLLRILSFAFVRIVIFPRSSC